ncbi:MAG: response regulator [Calditrichaeota bacterium]|nr:response regulator [Calditrichota bacterium]
MDREEYRLLIVDDEAQILDILGGYFDKLAYQVYRAPTAERGIEIVEENSDIDLIITDIELPGKSGIDLLKIVRQIREDIPVIFITGHKTIEFAIAAIKNGAQDFITKPFELIEVRKIAEKVLRYRKRSQKKERLFHFTKSMNINFEVPTWQLDTGVVSDYLAKFLLNSGFCDQQDLNQYNVAFRETLINSVEHGNLELASKDKGNDFEKFAMFEEERERRLTQDEYKNRLVKVAFLFSPNRFSLTVTDEGNGFNWQEYTRGGNRFVGLNTQASGRGFMIIYHIIDEVYFNEKGNSITLVKSRPAG